MGKGSHTLILSGNVKISAGGGDQVMIMLTETQLRSLAYHAGRAVDAIDAMAREATESSQEQNN